MGVPKQDLALADGRTMIEHVHATLRAVTDDVVILGEAKSLPECRRLSDRRPGCGPLGGIEVLLSSSLAGTYLIVPCDMPLLTPALLRRLLLPSDRPATVFDRSRYPLPARLTPDAREMVAQLLDQGEKRVHVLMKQLAAGEVAITGAEQQALMNVNTPAALAMAQGCDVIPATERKD